MKGSTPTTDIYAITYQVDGTGEILGMRVMLAGGGPSSGLIPERTRLKATGATIG